MIVACTSILQSDHKSLTAKVDELFAKWDKPNSPGAALAVIKDGSIIYKQGYGIANLEYNIPITPSTVFHAASVSKQFTAMSIALLADEGKLSLDDDIHKYLPEVPDFGKTITIQHLIHHTSGLRDQWELLVMAGWRLDDVITEEHVMKLVRHQKELNFDPGEEYLYCNTGYTLLAEIVERVSGKSFREYTETNIFKPLGMMNTHFHDDHEMIVKNRAYSYAPTENGSFKKSVLNYANVGATGLFTTVEDLAKWIKNFDDAQVGGSAVIEQMHERGKLNNGEELSYAFGLDIGEYSGLKTIGHSGGDAGYRSHVVRFPSSNFAVIILSNLSTLDPWHLAMQIADIYLADQMIPEKPKPKPAKRKEVKVSPDVYDEYEGKYQFQDGFLMSITKEYNRLMGQAMGHFKIELFPESETKFFLKVIDAQLFFQRDNTGKVTGLKVHMNGKNMLAKKIETVSLTSEQLSEFAGDYYSDELGTFYTIIVKDGRLVARHRRHDDIPLTQFAVDWFIGEAWWFRQIHFIRDEKKQITGFRLTSRRVRNLRFDKQMW